VADAGVDTDDGVVTVAGRGAALNFDGEGDEPAVGGSGDGGGQDTGSAVLKASGELAGGFMGLEDADAGQLDVLAVREHLDRTGGEPAGVSAAPFSFPAREAHWAALAAASLGV
jgi:hypothetical protein